MVDRVGQQLGNYRLISLLGQGGYAEVYLGQHVRLNQQAAIKVLHAHLTEQEAEHFQQEAQTIATLVHPGIVRVFDYDVQDGVPFLVIDYAPNGTLRRRYPKGSLVPLPVIVSVVKQVADALQYAHEQKFIHRDVKPENMLVGRRQEVLLSDFGIATIAHSTSSLNVDAEGTSGTLAYMAPEQIEGHPRTASDQYALGVVVYEWLCGERPFEGSVSEMIAQQLSMPPPSLHESVPAIPPEVEQVVFQALAKDPKARFASVLDLAEALGRASQLRPTSINLLPGEHPTHGPAEAVSYATVAVAPSQPPVPWTKESAEPPATVGELERRLVTVLFCDLAGFISQSEQLDPEDMHEIQGMYFGRMSQEIKRFGGSIEHYAGDSILALFGVPVAHEDDAERAVRCGLSMQAAIQEVGAEVSKRWGVELALRVGVNTGEVVSGLWDIGDRKYHAVSGDAVNRAARLQAVAEPGEVLVGEETMWLARKTIRFGERRAVTLKGKAGIVPVYAAVEVRQHPRGWEERGQHLPLVGRTTELTLLTSIWAKVVQGVHPHLVTVLGEPGIGKSRLVAAFEGSLPNEALVLHGRCLPYGEGRGYWALAEIVKEATGIRAADDMETASRKLAEMVATVVGQTETAWDPGEISHHLARLCGLDVDSDRPAPVADQRTLHVSVCRFIEALAGSQPLCLLFEDLHWADESLLDLIEFIAARVREAPLLILTQARPELVEQRPTWGRSLRNCTSLALEPLTEHYGRDLALLLCQERGLAEEVAEQVVRSAAGNPLFAEELVATIAERGQTTGIPSAIKALIAARLDTLPPQERRAIQLAAVIGKVFWAGGLRALGAAGDVTDHLEALEQKELLRSHHRSQMRGDREYTFKHDLIRDVAYETLSRADRRLLHQRLVGWIEVIGGERVEEYLDLLAYHAFQAGAWEKALDYARRAGEQAQGLYASRTAAEQFTRALEATRHLARTPPPKLYRARGQAYEMLGDFEHARRDYEQVLDAARIAGDGKAEWQGLLDMGFLWAGRDYEQAGAWLNQAVALAERLDDPIMRARSLNRLGNWLVNTGRSEEGLHTHREALRIFEEQQDTQGMAETLDLLGITYGMRGDRVNAVEQLGQAITLFRLLGDTQSLVSSLAMRAVQSMPGASETTCSPLRTRDECVHDAAEALRLSRQIDWMAGQAYTENTLAHTLLSFGEFGPALAHAQEAMHIATEIEHRQWMAATSSALGNIYMLLLAPAAAIVSLEAGLSKARELGSMYWMTTLAAYLGQAYVLKHDLSAAQATLQGVMTREQHPRALAERQVALVWGELALAQGEPDVALHIAEHLLVSVPGPVSGQPVQPIPHLLKLKGEALLALATNEVSPRRGTVPSGQGVLHAKSLPATSLLDEAVVALEEARRGATARNERPVLWTIYRALGQAYQLLQRKEQADQARTAGRQLIEELAMTIDDASLRDQFKREALNSFPQEKPPPQREAAKQAFGGLTTREREVASLVAQGKTSREIADLLVISERTAEVHVSNILGKLGFSSRAQIAAWVIEKGLAKP